MMTSGDSRVIFGKAGQSSLFVYVYTSKPYMVKFSQLLMIYLPGIENIAICGDQTIRFRDTAHFNFQR